MNVRHCKKLGKINSTKGYPCCMISYVDINCYRNETIFNASNLKISILREMPKREGLFTKEDKDTLTVNHIAFPVDDVH